MGEEKTKRVRRTSEQLVADADEKIAALNSKIEKIEADRAAANKNFDDKVSEVNAKIAALEKKKKDLLAPKPPRKTKKQKMADLLKQAEKSGMKPEEMAEKLGFSI